MNVTLQAPVPLSEQARAAFLEREGRPLFRADWKPALFIHFEVPVALLQPSVPFPLDSRDGQAFVSLVAFTFSNFRVRDFGRAGKLLLEPFLKSSFLNVRTYVRGPAGPGIFFLREYLSNPLTVPLGSQTFGLPYQFGRLDYRADETLETFQAGLRADGVSLICTARRRGADWGPAEENSPAEFLLERYVAYTVRRRKACFFRIWHEPWPQVMCEIDRMEPLPECFGPWSKAARFVCAHLSAGVEDVWLGRPRRTVQSVGSKKKRRSVTADVIIRSDADLVWKRSQTPKDHRRWDIRFTDIHYLPREAEGLSQTFQYTTALGFGVQIKGWGRTRPLGNRRGSALRFGSDDPKALIKEGSGSWRYDPVAGGTRFRTTYDYRTRFGGIGSLLDRAAFRPLMRWGTRWSFDRLRLWIERDIPPELAFQLWTLKIGARWVLGWVWILNGLLPKVLFVHPEEVAVVARSGLFWHSPETTLLLLGLAQTAAGVLLLTGWRERLGVFLSSLAILVLSFLVWQNDPGAFTDPYGGLIKNAGLILCAAAVWLLEPNSPKARRADGSGRRCN